METRVMALWMAEWLATINKKFKYFLFSQILLVNLLQPPTF